jgi:GH24 family phage-related lysozyme (muramidase)
MLIKNNIKEKTRLVGKVGGYWVNVEKYTKGDIPELVKDGLAVVVIFIGCGLFYFLLP